MQWRDEALGGRGELRLPPPEALHVTLAFLGTRAEAEVAEVARVGLAAVAGSPAPALLAREVVGVPRRRPRLLALDLGDPGLAATGLAATVSAALAASGLHQPPDRPFWPHLTLARVRGSRGAVALGGGELRTVAPTPLVFDRVTLFRSHLSSRGARYEAIGHHRLASPSRRS